MDVNTANEKRSIPRYIMKNMLKSVKKKRQNCKLTTIRPTADFSAATKGARRDD